MSLFWGTNVFDESVDKATSELKTDEDIATNLEICDMIRSKQYPAKDAMRSIKKRLNHSNPNVQLLALALTDVCIKNGGDHFLVEVASREFMDNLVSILKIPGLNRDVHNKILLYVQNWALAFEGKPTLAYVPQLYKTLKKEGYNFPPYDPAMTNSALVDSAAPPEWIDSDVCLRCRTAFTMMNRKHHCRNCGQVFDQACSSKSMPLPHFGITQDVRVCDTCHAKLTKAKLDAKPKSFHHRHHSTGGSHRSSRREDSDLQRAIQLSLQESSSSSSVNGHYRPGYVPAPAPSPSKWLTSEPPLVDRATYPGPKRTAVHDDDDDDDPEFRAAIEASLREANAPKPSAPLAVESFTEEPRASFTLPDYDLHPLESDTILTFNQTVDDVHAQGGRDLSRFPAVSELYQKANQLRPKLAMSLDDTGRKGQLLEDMHGKLSEAVKLYDQLLSNQIAAPRWRSPVAQQHGANLARRQTMDTWRPTSRAAEPPGQWSHGYHQTPSAVPPTLATVSAPQPPAQQAPTPAPAPAPASPYQQPAYPQTWGTAYQAMEQQQPYTAPAPVTQYQQPPQPTPSQYQAPPQTYQSPVPSTQQALPPQAPPQAPPQVLSPPPAPQASPYTAYQAPQPPTQYQPQQYAAPPAAQYTPSPPAPFLSRANTIAHPGQYNVARAAPQQQQQPLPMFPTAPTSNPTSSLAMFSAPQGLIEQNEKKEAPLITFD